MIYNVVINEEQRSLIEEGLDIMLRQHFQTDELEALHQKIQQIPRKERDHPGDLHDLTQ